MKPRPFIVLIVLVVASRIPLLSSGFGADGDAWRVATSALDLWNECAYTVSRFPGFPVHEFLSAPIIGLGGSLGSNLATLMVFVLSLVALRKILRQWKVPTSHLLLVAYAFFPILWKNSAITMDYEWGLAAILCSIAALLNGRLVWGGILLGVAAGTRITHIGFLLPMLWFIEGGGASKRLTFTASALGAAAIVYLPVLFSNSYADVARDFSPGIWHAPLWKPAAGAMYRAASTLGVPGFITIALIAFLRRAQIMQMLKRREFVFSIASIGMTLLIFGFLPDQREYLIPMIPFLLITLFFVTTEAQAIAVTVVLVSHAVLTLDVVDHGSTPPQVRVGLSRGVVLKEIADRGAYARWREQVASLPVPDSTVVMVGYGPIFGLGNPLLDRDRDLEHHLRQSVFRRKHTDVVYVYSLNRAQLEEFRARGFQISYVDRVKEYLESFIGYRLGDEDVRELETPPDTQSPDL